ncbi:hypothetical protein Tco_0094305 [Tanacetum coccineum]
MFMGDVSIFLFLVFDEVQRLLLVDVDLDEGVTSLTTSLPLLLVVACDLDDVICLDDGAMVCEVLVLDYGILDNVVQQQQVLMGWHSWLSSQHGFHWVHS